MQVIPFQIQIQNLSKSFHKSPIFKNLNFTIIKGDRLIVTGPNGSGKSTFLKVLVGKMKADSGNVLFIKNKKIFHNELLYLNVAWDAPFIELYPYFNIQETFYWHFQFVRPILQYKDWLKILELKSYQNKELKYLSSGTLQRLKVGLALFSDTPILVLDEPTANMDNDNAKKIIDLVDVYSKNRILIIASNLFRETAWLDELNSKVYISEKLIFSIFRPVLSTDNTNSDIVGK